MNLRNFGLDTATFSGSLDVKLKACAAAGFSQIMLWAKDLADHGDGFDAAVKVVRDSGLEVSGLQATIEYEGLADSLHAYKLDIAKATLQACSAIRAPLLIVCSTCSPYASTDFQKIASDLRKLANLAVPLGVRIGYKAVPAARAIRDNASAAEVIELAGHANLRLIIDSFQWLVQGMLPETLADIDPLKIGMVQLSDINLSVTPSPGEDTYPASHMRLFPGEGIHCAELADLVRRLDRIGYRGDYSFEVFNDDYLQLPQQLVADRARRAAKWVTDQVLRRSLPLRDHRVRDFTSG